MREAAIACILRQSKTCKIDTVSHEILLIRRSFNRLDPWSGDIALPGGKLESNESQIDACKRETEEEIGITLENFQYVGILDKRKMSRGKRSAIVYPHIFSCQNFDQELHLSEKEVSAAWWQDLSSIANSTLMTKKVSSTEKMLRGYLGDNIISLWIWKLLRTLDLTDLHFKAIEIRPTHELMISSHSQPEDHSELILWGMTFSVVQELCVFLKIPLNHMRDCDKTLTRKDHIIYTCNQIGFAVENYYINCYFLAMKFVMSCFRINYNPKILLKLSGYSILISSGFIGLMLMRYWLL